MKSFKKFLEEVTIKGNPGIPGEGDKRPGDKDYLSDIEKRAKDKLGITGREFPPQLGQRINQLLQFSLEKTRGKETQLEELAKQVILDNFGDILEGVELDIKLLRSGSEIDKFMKDETEEEESDMPTFREIKDSELIRRIHKAKIGNVIIQGEAKNTKHILHTEEVKDSINEIFGAQAEAIFRTWDEITKIADKMDWIIPIQVKAQMMEQHPEGMAGAVKVDFKKKDKDEDSEYKEEEEVQNEEEIVDEFTPIIKARGIDFPMLLHETVKGIFELIAAVSQPGMDAPTEEIEMAQTVKMNVSSFEDEVEDFRTGPEIAADFRDFINENDKAMYTPNMRAYIFGKMMDPEYMTSQEFLDLFRGILNNTEEARKIIDEIIDEVVDELKAYDLGEVLPDYEEESGYEDDYEQQRDYGDVEAEAETEQEDDEEVDYSEMTQRQLQELIDDALDSGDFDKVRDLSQFLKEGKEIYLRELERINETYTRKNKK